MAPLVTAITSTSSDLFEEKETQSRRGGMMKTSLSMVRLSCKSAEFQMSEVQGTQWSLEDIVSQHANQHRLSSYVCSYRELRRRRKRSGGSTCTCTMRISVCELGPSRQLGVSPPKLQAQQHQAYKLKLVFELFIT